MIILLLLVLGLCLGSFVNALVWRLHEQEELRSKKDKKSKAFLEKLSITRGRSMCPECHHPLAPKDLVPVLSWAWLGGKCRYCRAPIQDNPVAEVVTALLFIASYIFWPSALHSFGLVQFCFWLAFLVGFVALALYDIRWYILPDKIVFPLVGLALAQLAVQLLLYHGGLHALVVAAWGVAIASGLFWILFEASKGTWIGGGDVKLGIVLGLLLGGPLRSLLLLFLSSLIGTLVSLPLLLSGKANRTTLLPYGPFLLAATIVLVLIGGRVTDWFNTLVLP